jgi:hypothetical protein
MVYGLNVLIFIFVLYNEKDYIPKETVRKLQKSAYCSYVNITWDTCVIITCDRDPI